MVVLIAIGSVSKWEVFADVDGLGSFNSRSGRIMPCNTVDSCVVGSLLDSTGENE